MIPAKLFGAVLVIISCVLWSHDRKAKLRSRLQTLESLTRFVRFTRREIDCFATPFPNILASFSDDILDKYSFSVDPRASAEHLPLDPAERDDLVKFIDSVGRGFAEGELKLCDLYIEIFSSAAERAREEYPKNAKVQSSLAFLVGACAVILLI